MDVTSFEFTNLVEDSILHGKEPTPGAEAMEFQRKIDFNEGTTRLTIVNPQAETPSERRIATLLTKTIPQKDKGSALECFVEVPSLKIHRKHFFLITDAWSQHLAVEKVKSALGPAIMSVDIAV